MSPQPPRNPPGPQTPELPASPCTLPPLTRRQLRQLADEDLMARFYACRCPGPGPYCGDAAFDVVRERYYQTSLDFMARTLPYEEAEEATQDVWFRLYLSQGR